MLTALRHIFSLGIKEIIGLFRDPLLLFLVFYSLTVSVYVDAVSAHESIKDAAVAIVDEDQSPLTQRLHDALMPPMFLPPATISRADIETVMDRGDYTFVLVFPPNFQERVMANHRPEIQLNVDATRMSQAFTGTSYIQQIMVTETAKFLMEQKALNISDPADIIIRNRFNPNLLRVWDEAVNAMVNNIAMIALILTGAALIRERERGTLEHLLVTPSSPAQIMVAKIWSMSLVVLVSTGISLAVVVRWLLHVPVAGSVTLFMTAVVINLFAMTSMGIFLACYAKDMPQLGILVILVLMPMQILSGGSATQSNMPAIVRFVMQFAPTTYLVQLSQAILFRGTEFAMVWKLFLKMLLLGGLYFFIALLRFRKSVAS